jgi:hypothetical protein
MDEGCKMTRFRPLLESFTTKMHVIIIIMCVFAAEMPKILFS